MGEQDVQDLSSDEQLRLFMKALLEDVRALELMLERSMFETGVRRMGAEQEMFLVDSAGRPAPLAVEVLKHLDPALFTTELARFNLEANLPPTVFGGNCLRDLEATLEEVVGLASDAAAKEGARIALTGILPSLRQSDLGLDNMTPNPRYFALNNALSELRGKRFFTTIRGVDELNVRHGNVMMEACNTSFQIHFQVAPDEFARLYNVAQLVTGPVLAASVNSPVLLGHRLWQETRVALFQQSIDARSTAHKVRGQRARVSFGDRWIDDSVIEIFREDIARFRVVLATDVTESDSLESVEAGKPASLQALRLHNGTVYRWNRPCYGVHEGVAHLRIENRALPSGPTVIDEVANAAFYFGLMVAVTEEYGDVRDVFTFDVAKDNFIAAARRGLEAQFTWDGGRTIAAGELIRDELLPLARRGLEMRDVDADDIDRYLGVLDERTRTGRTGARWILSSIASMGDDATRDERDRALVTAAISRQFEGNPVHTWTDATLDESGGWRESYRTVEQFMQTDLFTVRPQDLVNLAASLMEWERIRYVPVEDDQGALVGIVTYRCLLRLVGRVAGTEEAEVAVADVMRTNPMTVSAGTPTIEAIRLMRDRKVGCLPVVQDGKLVGMVTERDLIAVSAKLLEEHLAR
jgi:CBS domain-containing protein